MYAGVFAHFMARITELLSGSISAQSVSLWPSRYALCPARAAELLSLERNITEARNQCNAFLKILGLTLLP